MKQLAVVKRLFLAVGDILVSIAISERFKQESMCGLFARTEKILEQCFGCGMGRVLKM